uniref:Uncharacterized protein n=1 Tax=Chelonoidis abingdonii TaxID=106734 RepID=A0A8C0HFS4_CHEAB
LGSVGLKHSGTGILLQFMRKSSILWTLEGFWLFYLDQTELFRSISQLLIYFSLIIRTLPALFIIGLCLCNR